MYQLKFSEGEIERNINYIFKDTLELNINLIASILICEGDYSLALKYLNTVQADNTDDQLIYLKGLCQFRISDFQECIRLFSDIKLQEIKKETIIYKFRAYMNSNISSSIDEIMNGEEKECRVCKSYNMIINSQTPNVLTDDKEISKEYSVIIFKLLDILIEFQKYDEFEKALELLNLINDNNVLLELGKLYYKHRKYDLSKKELLRSINLMNVMDEEGAFLLSKLYTRKI